MVTKNNQVEEKKTVFKGEYFCAVGRRKTAVAQVRVYLNENAEINETKLVVNGKDIKSYFPLVAQQNIFFEPLRIVGLEGKCAISVLVKGGGLSGQVGATKLGISRALVKFDNEFRAILKTEGLLTRDARKVERKKPGLKKARRASQWAKR